MKSRLAILALLLVLAAALGAVGVFVMGGDEGGQGGDAVAIGPGGLAERGEQGPGASRAPAPAAANGRSEVAPSVDRTGLDEPDPASPVSDAAVELGPGEALLGVEVRALEDDRPVEGVSMLLAPEDDPDAPNERSFSSEARVGQSPHTDARGRARFVVPAGEAFRLRASARAGRNGPAETIVRGLRAGERSRVVLKVPTEDDLAFYGRIVDAASGEPVAGASVLVRREDLRRIRDRIEDVSETLATAKTDARGDFDVRMPSWLSLHLRIEAPGYALALVPVAGEAAIGTTTADERATIELRRAAELAVRVVDEDGAGLDGRTVRVRAAERELLQQDGERVVSDEAKWEVVTDADGRGALVDLPPGADLTVEVHERGVLVLHLPQPLRIGPGERRELQLLVRQGLSLRGRLVDRRGMPVPRAEVWMLPARVEGPSFVRRTDRAQDKSLTDSDGFFTFRDVATGLWTVAPSPAFPANLERDARVAPVGRTVRVEDLADGAQPEELQLEVDRGLYVAGHVVDDEGQPIPSIDLTCTSVELGFVLTTTAGEDGAFELGPLARGGYKLVAQPRTAAASSRVEAQAGEEDLQVVVGSGGIVRGLVVDEAGEPVAAELTIESTDDPDDPRLQRFESKDGNFRFENNAPGTYAVVARTTDGRIGIARDLKIERGEPVPLVRVEVARGAKVSVRWTADPVPWMCSAEQDGLLVSFGLDPNGGTIEMTVPAGRLKVGYASEALNKWDETFVDVGPGETREVVFP